MEILFDGVGGSALLGLIAFAYHLWRAKKDSLPPSVNVSATVVRAEAADQSAAFGSVQGSAIVYGDNNTISLSPHPAESALQNPDAKGMLNRKDRLIVCGLILVILVSLCAAVYFSLNNLTLSSLPNPKLPSSQKLTLSPTESGNSGKKSATTAERVTVIIAHELQVNDADVKPEKDFEMDLGADPYDVAEIIMALEQEYKISIPEGDAKNLKTVGETIKYIEQREVRAKKAGGTGANSGAKPGAKWKPTQPRSNIRAGGQSASQQQCEPVSICNQDSQVNAPQTVNNFAPPARTLTKDQHDKIVSALAGKQFIVKFGYLIDAPDARQFASKLCAAVKDAIPATNCGDIWVMANEGPSASEGVIFRYKGDAVPTGTRTQHPLDTPVGTMINAFVAAGMNRGTGHADPTMRDGEVLIVVGTATTQ